jgi:outer membrane PBP1 activator LpoA protein
VRLQNILTSFIIITNSLKRLNDTILKSHTLKLFLLAALLTLSACDTGPVKPEPGLIDEPGSVTEKQASLSEQAEKLLTLAEDSNSPVEQQKYRIQAARLHIEAGEIELAKKQLNILNENKTPNESDTAAILILSAEIAVAEKDYLLANELITEIKPITRDQQIDFYALKADLDYISGRYMFVVDRRVQLDTYIIDEKSKYRNDKKIWAALSSMSNAQLNSQQTSNLTIRSWLDLAKVMRSGQQNISQLENDMLDWGTRHPGHLVNQTFLNELITNYQKEALNIKQIAVLLPMQGDLSTISANIKNGLLSAFYNDTNSPVKPVINFYDTSNKETTFYQLYQQAINDGATNIIGPLDKVVISQLAQQNELDIPVLTLNYSENTLSHTENLFQFGLAPEDEARQVAELAIRQNKKSAAVFYPDSEWGNRLNNVFTEHYESLGGKVLTSANYATNTNDYRRPIRQLFNLDQSDIRHRKVEDTIGKKAQTISYRRQDIDMIFLAATHRSARSIMPAFKFHHAGDLPVYSTSHVYTGTVSRELDRDLNGLIFCDLPWVLQHDSPLNKVFTKNWPQQENFTRLFALGVDAYYLTYNLDYLKNKDYAFYDGQTGNIQLDNNNRITRKLLWAKFENGLPVYFEPVNNIQNNELTEN